MLFWGRLLEIMKNMVHEGSIADPHMYFSRNKDGKLAIWLSWIDNYIIVGLSHVMKDGEKLVKEIKIEDVGKLKKFVGSANITPPVTIQLFLDKFSAGKKKQVTPAEINTVLKSQNLVRFWQTKTNLRTGQESEI